MTTMPSRNSEGYQVWNPSVGNYFKPASNERESYGGVVGALQDQIATQNGVVKAYPPSFAGIISAIKELTFTLTDSPVDPDVKPPGGEIGTDSEGNPIWIVTEAPRDGELWFDTRQGRLFIAWEGEYYQTNGADGLAVVTTTTVPPQSPVIGQFWWDVTTTSLYIFDGFWRDINGEIDGVWSEGATPIWRAVTSTSGGDVSTSTLPLSGATRSGNNPSGLVLPDLNDRTMFVQQDYNEWIYDALESLDTAIEAIQNEAPPVAVTIGTTSPANAVPGDLWYDSAALELSIYYQDDNTSQWAPTSVTYNYDSELAALSSEIETEKNTRSNQINTINEKLKLTASSNLTTDLTSEITRICQELVEIKSAAILKTNSITELQTKLQILQNAAPDLTGLQTIAEASSQFNTLTSAINALPTERDLVSVAASIPSIANLSTTAEVTQAIANITDGFLPRNGGIIQGNLKVNKNDIGLPGLDFTSAPTDSRMAFKFATNSGYDDNTETTFGTTNNFWEYAYNFTSKEDFCWVYNDTNKVFSITKDGPACSTLYLGDIKDNTIEGRVLSNKIDVKDRLVKYQTAFEQMRVGVQSSTDFTSLKENILSSIANF